MTQPEALMLADKLEQRFWITSTHHYLDRDAAAELRRLHAENRALTDALFQAQEAAKALLAQRDALLEALKTVEWHGQGSCWVVDADKIAAAIKAAEENNDD